ncbi:MAG TPA: hypothetical protein VMU89_07325 [Thermomicrobiaceae bacterium]|nr:hypothetical protein [Thermomicrobiaceae bacterium]
MRTRGRATAVLVAVVALNYAAQIPYYLHQYYLPRHQLPSPLGTLLLGLTLLWFVVGYRRYLTGRRFGYGLLLGFLVVQVLFYGHSVVLGLLTGAGAVAQLTTSSRFLLVIFTIGYLNFAVAAYYVYWLLRSRPPRTA